MNQNSEIVLDTRLVGNVTGKFYIPSYQRGYRWRESEVKRLLDDVYTSNGNSYCLQPIVVRRKEEDDTYELIDGQQRLTTIYLIYKYLSKVSGGFFDEPKFLLSYQNRSKSEWFLQSIDLSLKDDNVDFWFISKAYETIDQWFSNKDRKSTITNINKYFDETIKIIWYEVSAGEDAVSMFARLNIGKIPLTSAELVKAMFLKRSTEEIGEKKQEEIAFQWDYIEKELQKDDFWFFLTNNAKTAFQTRIDIVLDLMSKKNNAANEKYFTFYYFDRESAHRKLTSIWEEIQHTFLILKDWFEDHEFYHKIGYLVTSESVSLLRILEISKDKTKKEFKKLLDEEIKKSIELGKSNNYAELSYEKSSEAVKIKKLLLLFNIESVKQSGNQTEKFPFDKFKDKEAGRERWSLEHIHAQNSQGMSKKEDWQKWLGIHIPAIKLLLGEENKLTHEILIAKDKENLGREEFTKIQEEVLDLLSEKTEVDYLHTISNLALLDTHTNSALNNSAFAAKRDRIISMDKSGEYIPFCTRMVFLKYYTQSKENQMLIWSEADRKEYINAINNVLKAYLREPILTESGS